LSSTLAGGGDEEWRTEAGVPRQTRRSMTRTLHCLPEDGAPESESELRIHRRSDADPYVLLVRTCDSALLNRHQRKEHGRSNESFFAQTEFLLSGKQNDAGRGQRTTSSSAPIVSTISGLVQCLNSIIGLRRTLTQTRERTTESSLLRFGAERWH
jgi:hypothetical protein